MTDFLKGCSNETQHAYRALIALLAEYGRPLLMAEWKGGTAMSSKSFNRALDELIEIDAITFDDSQRCAFRPSIAGCNPVARSFSRRKTGWKVPIHNELFWTFNQTGDETP